MRAEAAGYRGRVPADAPREVDSDAVALDPGGANQRPARPAKLLFARTVLALEAFVVCFAALVAYGLRVADPAAIAVGGAALALAALVAAATVRTVVGYPLGWALQGWLLLSGLVIPAMFAVGGVFAVLWVVGLRLGGRIDRERAERQAAG